MSIPASEIRRRLSDFFHEEKSKQFTHDPEDPSAAVLKEPWQVNDLNNIHHHYFIIFF